MSGPGAAGRRVFVTGGAGYIGSHAIVELLAEGHEVFAVDNFSNSRSDVPDAIARLTGRSFGFAETDIRDTRELVRAIADFRPDAVIHFAGLKSVGDSVADPLGYYDCNVGGSLSLLQAMATCGIRRIVFSSSATVYGEARSLPVDESHPLAPQSAYGRTKLQIEQMLCDLAASDPAFGAAILRYFNPVGCHPSTLIGERPPGRPANLVPIVAQAAAGAIPHLTVFGNDYDTSDGTGIRDYIHVVDLARAHVRALHWTMGACGARPFNLGVGRGISVLEILQAFEKIANRPVPFRIAARRHGDIAVSYADPRRALEELGWKAEFGITEICQSAWAWQQRISPVPSPPLGEADIAPEPQPV